MSPNRLSRRTVLTVALAMIASPALAHHGWRWTANGEFELSGRITAARLGNPHGLLTIQANDETWTAEIGQPWRNARAGLTDEMFAVGTDIVLRGHRAEDPERLVMKAERILIGGTLYDLYPNRS